MRTKGAHDACLPIVATEYHDTPIEEVQAQRLAGRHFARQTQRIPGLAKESAFALGWNRLHPRWAGMSAVGHHGLRFLRLRFDQLDTIAVRILDEGDQCRTVLHRARE